MGVRTRRTAIAFDISVWRDQLVALNPWARGLSIDQSEKAFATARQQATVERLRQGKDAWKVWAEGMLSLRKGLEDAGVWVAKREGPGAPLSSKNDEARDWLLLAAAVFSRTNSNYTFDRDADFREFTFPGEAWFSGAVFSGGASFDEGNFFDEVSFDRATFSDEASFAGATFSGDAWFGGANFSGGASFAGANFCGEAWFTGATFAAGTYFRAGRFWGPVNIAQAKFRGAAEFDESVFEQGASFDAIDSQATFSLANATFRQVPSFFGAQIRALRLDNVRTPRYPLLGWTPDMDTTARFRELRRRAAEAQDRNRELEFFAQEVRTSRFHTKGLPSFVPRVWEWHFWFGLLYGIFSDFGRSLWRPLFSWLVLLSGFAVFYLGEHEQMEKARNAINQHGTVDTVVAYAATTGTALAGGLSCVVRGRKMYARTDAVTEALHLSLRNALVFEFGRSEGARRTYGCLFGFDGAGEQEIPIVSPRASLASAVQSLASAVLIFLFLLALRNRLRLK
jgi:uncharacterized protein YjbI with pentapeptide repeats